MSFRRSDGPADRAESERLLDAASAGQPPSPGADPLAHLLAAAAAPASPDELAGAEQALAAFRAARANPPVASASVPRWRRLRVGVAAWTAGLAAVATAGVAVAAVNLDWYVAPSPAPTTPGSTRAGSTDTGGPDSPAQSREATPTAGGSVPAPSGTPVESGSGGPGRPTTAGNLVGQCRAYLQKSDRQRAKALETPGFADLVIAAGGADQVDDYCVRLVPEEPGQPSRAARPTRSPQAAPRSPQAVPGSAPAAPRSAPAPQAGKPAAG